MSELKPCPFCKGKAKVSFKDHRFKGYTLGGYRMVSYRVQVICNKCRSRGKPIITETLVNPNPYYSKWGNQYFKNTEKCQAATDMFAPYVERAIEAWNRRATDDLR